MDDQQSRKILGEDSVKADGSIRYEDGFACWDVGDTTVTLDGSFSIEELEAIIWRVRGSLTSLNE